AGSARSPPCPSWARRICTAKNGWMSFGASSRKQRTCFARKHGSSTCETPAARWLHAARASSYLCGVRKFSTPTMSLNSAINLDDLRELARRKLPRIAFDFIEGGADDEACLQR